MSDSIKSAWIRFQIWVNVHHVAKPATADQRKAFRLFLAKRYEELSEAYRTEILPGITALIPRTDEQKALQGAFKRTEVYRALETYEPSYPYPTQTAKELQEGLPTFYQFLKARKDILAFCSPHSTSLGDLLAALKSRDAPKEEISYVEYLLDSVRAFEATLAKEMPAWEEELVKLEAAQKARIAASRQQFNMGPAWVGAWLFADAGGQGEPALWVKQSASGTIADVTCGYQRHTFVEDARDDTYNSVSKDPRDRRALVPNEVLAMYRLRPLIGSENVVHIRNWRANDKDNDKYRVYMEFCPHGDLNQFAEWYLTQLALKPDESVEQYADRRSEFHRRTRDEIDRPFVAELFIWHTFECLAIAGLLMEQGSRQADPINAWRLILHLDWKSGNIFLGTPSVGRFEGYPTPKVGDFGLCRMIPRNDETRTGYYCCPTGTRFNRSAEQSGHIYENETEVRRPDTKTNVWGVGIVLWSIMELEEGDHRLEYGDEGSSGHEGDPELVQEPTFRNRVQQRYSKDLRDLISRCLRYEQADRPTFRQILRQIRRHADGTSAADHAGGLRAAPKDSSLWLEDRHLLDHKADGWPLQTSLQGLAKLPAGLARPPSPPTEDDSDSEQDPPGDPNPPISAEKRSRDATTAPSPLPKGKPKRLKPSPPPAEEDDEPPRVPGRLKLKNTAAKDKAGQQVMDPAARKRSTATQAPDGDGAKSGGRKRKSADDDRTEAAETPRRRGLRQRGAKRTG
ncbi:hypothetical protein LTR36_007272 [Oleoguttula mirabilis]|uniref:non-specific serine/threonine protein kinase n=1 Tax=Oleoguttula mirabilis TaxID=1507867 RepID=A0AAV9JAU9_9PEZI|nr:hypothetical protein LTR36_007272 [Oleoguttula mirabilis]